MISGKEALIALANGESVQYSCDDYNDWKTADIGELQIKDFGSGHFSFRLKPRTITINGIEVPAPFEPKDLEECWTLSTRQDRGYGWVNYSEDEPSVKFGTWQTEDEIKQVVAALRSVFNP